MIEGNGDEDVSFAGGRIGFDMSMQRGRILWIDAYGSDVYGDFRVVDRLLKYSFDLMGIVETHLTGAIHNDLRSVRSAQSESTHIGFLSFGERVRGVWIFPAVAVPVVDVLAQHDEVRTGDGLLRVKFLQELIGRWAARATLRREKLNEDRVVVSVAGGVLFLCIWRCEGGNCQETEEQRRY